jgi:undecaprenyl-diphosphatase
MDMLIEILKAAFLGIVEGITEWLPISSTGHMILVDEFLKLNVSDKFLELFLVVIQIGAICAVIILYFTKLNPFSHKKTPQGRRATWSLWGKVVVGCIPAAVVGLTLDDFFNEYFYNAPTVAIALIFYGIVFIVLEARNRRRLRQAIESRPRGKHAKVNMQNNGEGEGDLAEASLFKIKNVEELDFLTAFKIGLFQCLAIIPGTSRSGSTIIGGMLCGCSRTAATEFTFFLAIPVMFGWGLLKCIKYILALGLAMTTTEICVLVVGVVVAFVVSIISIKFLMGYIKKNDFTAFGIYRIVLGACVLGYFGLKAAGLF